MTNEQSKTNCPNCHDVRYYEYTKSDFTKKFIGKLQPASKLKNGNLFQCPACGNYWYEDDDNYHQYRAMRQGEFERLQAWDSVNHVIREEFLPTLNEIGATPPDYYGNNRDFIDFPCTSLMKNGEELEFSLIRFQKYPPFLRNSEHYRHIYSVNEIESIKSSRYALNKYLRYKTTRAREIRNGFAPTSAKTPDDQFFILNWTTDFFYMDGIDGSLLEFAEKHPHESEMKYDNSKFEVNYIIGDWSDDLVKFRINKKQQLTGVQRKAG